MAINKLPVNFQDDIIDTSVTDKRRYNFIENSDGTKSLEDVTTYFQIGTDYGAKEINVQNQAINDLIDKTSNLDNTQDSEKRVAYAEEAGTAENSNHSATSDSLKTPRKINGVDFDGTKDITIKDTTKLSKDEDFILINQSELEFIDNVCNIYDERIKSTSLADVYFTSDTIEFAEKATMSVETFDGYVSVIANVNPTSTLKASIHIRVV